MSCYYDIGLNCCNFNFGNLLCLKLFWQRRPTDTSCFARERSFLSSTFQLRVALGDFTTAALTPNAPARSLRTDVKPLNTPQVPRARAVPRAWGRAEEHGVGSTLPLPRTRAIAAPEQPQPSRGQGCLLPTAKTLGTPCSKQGHPVSHRYSL